MNEDKNKKIKATKEVLSGFLLLDIFKRINYTCFSKNP